MILIRVSETGFVSGNAFETIGYEGDKNSRIIHTIYNKPRSIDNDVEIVCGYFIKSKYLNECDTLIIDENNNVVIPSKFMQNTQRLWFQFYIKNKDNNEFLMKSDPFHLNIESSVGKGAKVILKPGAENFISVDTIDDRNGIPRSKLANGKVVRVNDNGHGESIYYSWDNDNAEWVIELISINNIRNLSDILSWHTVSEENYE